MDITKIVDSEELLEPLAKNLQEYTAVTYAMLDVLVERDPEFAADFRRSYEARLTSLCQEWSIKREIAVLNTILENS